MNTLVHYRIRPSGHSQSGPWNREWDKLDMAGRDKFLSEKLRTHGNPDFNAMEVIDVTT